MAKKRKNAVYVTDEEQESIRFSLVCMANFIETGNPVMSAQDAQEQRKTFSALNLAQMERVAHLRRLAKLFDNEDPTNPNYIPF